MGLRLLRVCVPAPGRRGQLRRAARLLVKARVGRVLVPTGFGAWDLLGKYGLSPVETEDFCRAMAAPLALGALKGLGLDPGAAAVALRGERVTRPMRMAALALCPRVRSLTVSAPLGGEALQAELRREYGVADVAEGRRTPDVAVHFSEIWGGGAVVLRLYGPAPELAGLTLDCAVPELPEDCQRLPLLAALWETGRLRMGACEVFPNAEA